MIPHRIHSFRLPLLAILGVFPVVSQVFGPNLIANGDAESGAGSTSKTQVTSVPSWTNSGSNVITYGSSYGLTPTSILPPNVGKNYFSSGTANSMLTQTVNLTSGTANIDAGTVVYTISGYFGGYSTYDDVSTLTISYLGAANNLLGTANIGGVKSADRESTGLYFRRQIGLVPVGTRSASVTLSFVFAKPGSDNNAYADNLSFILNVPAAPSTFLGRNLIVNGDAEQGLPLPPNTDLAPDVPGWVRSANFTTDTYANNSDYSTGEPAPPDRGTYLFLGGPSNTASFAYQDIDISPLAAQVDAGSVKFAFGAWIGGYEDQEDYAVVTSTFMNWAGASLGASQLGPVTAGDRGRLNGILQRSSNGSVPAADSGPYGYDASAGVVQRRTS